MGSPNSPRRQGDPEQGLLAVLRLQVHPDEARPQVSPALLTSAGGLRDLFFKDVIYDLS